jgi:hypothetical protein
MYEISVSLGFGLRAQLLRDPVQANRPSPTAATAQPRILTPHAGRSRNRAEQIRSGTATVSRIATEANLSPANVYRHFPSKDALLREVFSRGSAVNKEELAREVDVGQVASHGNTPFRASGW